MQNFLRFLLRLLVVPFGGIVAMTAATVIVVTAHWGELVALAEARPDEQGAWLIAFIFVGPVLAFVLSLTVIFTAVPAALGALIAECFAIRSWIFHALNGGLSAWIGWTQMQDIQERYRFMTEPKIMVAAGLAGGLAYWLVAGWSAGFWKPVFGPAPVPAHAPVPPNP